MASDESPLPSPGTPEWAWLRERLRPKDELAAMFHFADALRRHLGHRCSSPQRTDQHPPDYWVLVDGQNVGVEVTAIRASHDPLHANARVQAVLRYLEHELRDVETEPAVDLLYEPECASGVPEQRNVAREFRDAVGMLKKGGPLEHLELRSGRLCVLQAAAGKGPVRVMHQGFFAVPGPGMWQSAVNETISWKLQHYGTRFCSPCWLLLNLKPYLWSEQDSTAFLTCDLPISDKSHVRAVFDRVYALTAYISDKGDGPPCPVRRVL